MRECVYACVCAQSCPTLHPMDCGSPGSSVHGISQARILEWVCFLFKKKYAMHAVLLNRTFKKIFNSFSGLKLLASQNAYLNDYFSPGLLFVTLWTIATRLFCPWNYPGKNTGVGCHFLLQGTFLTQGSNPHLLHC